MAPPEQYQLLCIKYCILRDPDWLTIPIYPYIWQFFLGGGQKLSRKSFRVPFLRQGSKSKILNFKKFHIIVGDIYSFGTFLIQAFCQARVLVLVRSWSSPGLIIVKIGSMSSLKNIYISISRSSILRKRSQRTRADAKISVHHHPPTTTHHP